jgi:AAA family ATP:ADP antiporter
MTVLPKIFYPFISILRNWTYAVFYTLAQLWGSVVLSLLFWGFANEVTSVPEAKKYYPLFGLLANVALIFSGQYVKMVSDMRSSLPAGVDAWGFSLKYLMGAVVGFGGVVAFLYNHMQKNVLTDPECVPVEKVGPKKKKSATSMSLGESAKYLLSSPYIRYLAMLVIGYGMSINIVEVTWKGKLKEAFPDPNSYATFMGNFSSVTGAVTLVMMILGRFILEKFGWGVAAMIPPVTLALTGVGFFGMILGGKRLDPFFMKIGTTPLMAACLLGAAQNIASKSTKYSLFDPCKEMAYIPLDAEQKTKGKAAIDVIGNPLGKSGGSFIQQVLIVFLGSLAASTPYLAGLLFVITGGWIVSAKNLAPLFDEAMKKKEANDKAASNN